MSDRCISCIICAYNEAPRIGDVLRVVVDHPLVSETIVVDDGSTDGTSDVVKRFLSVKLLVQNPNQGKSRAFARGIEAASGDFIMMLDADLRNLTKENVTALIEPILSGSADTSMSLRGNSLLVCRLIGLDYLSGERVMPKEMISKQVSTIASLTPYGIESFLNERIIEEKLRVAIVRFDNVVNMTKRAKIGWWRGVYAQWKMVLDILRVISLIEVVRQNYLLLKLARKYK
jgi:glycosyltransferase involved in cell wall biosynthesis